MGYQQVSLLSYLLVLHFWGGSLVAYDTETKEIEEFGQIRKRKEFVKAIVADEETGEIFVSIGSSMDLLVKKPKAKNFTSFLPSKYTSGKYAQDLVLTDDFIVARLYPSNVAVVFDRKTLKIVDEFELNSKTVSTLSPDVSPQFLQCISFLQRN